MTVGIDKISAKPVAIEMQGINYDEFLHRIRKSSQNSCTRWDWSISRLVSFISHNSSWSPADIPTTAWYDASDAATITIETGVSQWDDKSGNDNHAIQASASRQPDYTSNDSLANNMGSIGKNSRNGKFGLYTPSMSARNIYVVAYYATGIESIFDNYTCLLLNALNADDNDPLVRNYRVMAQDASSDWITTNRFNEQTFINGSDTPSNTALPMPLTILRFRASAIRTQAFLMGHGETDGRTWYGGYCELIYTDGSESLATQQKIEGYLAWKWGMMYQLPDSNPYKYDGSIFGFGELWNPSEVSTTAWYDASDESTITVETGVSQWDDKSTNNRHMVQGTGSSQPITGVQSLKGFNMIQFDSQFLSNSTVFEDNVDDNYTFVYVTRAINFGSYNDGRIFNIGGTQHRVYQCCTLDRFRWTISGLYGATVDKQNYSTVDENLIISFKSVKGASDTKRSLWKTGDAFVTEQSLASTTGILNSLDIGSTENVDVAIGELVVFDSDIGDETRQKVEGYLAWKWGLVGELPAGHPYKNEPPYKG